MNKPRQLVVCLVLTLAILAPIYDVVTGLPPLAAGTFPTGTIVVPMDDKQTDRIRVYGLIHEFLRSAPDLGIARIIEPPDVTMRTSLTPGGAVYQGGPFLIDQKYLTNVNSLLATPAFNKVLVTRLTAPFTSNQVFFVRQPTKILVIKGIWGRTDFTLNQMAINYTMVSPDQVLSNPSIIKQYSLIVVDCPGWFGNPTSYPVNKRTQVQAVYDVLRAQAQAGNEIIYTDIALKDLDQTFPGYVQLLGPNVPGSWDSTFYNPPGSAGTFPSEFPSQYYNAGPNPNSIKIATEGSGYVVSAVQPAHASDVRILIDSNKFSLPSRYAILAFYFQFGSGIVEGLGFHPQQQLPVGSKGYYAVLQAYGDKFVHGPQIDFLLQVTPSTLTIAQNQVATYSVNVVSLGSFSSPVSLQVSGFPTPSTPNLSPASVTPPPGGTVPSTLTIATTYSTPAGSYNITVTGTSTLPAITRSQTVQLNVTLARPDFALNASPTLLILNQSTCGNISVSVRGLGAFNSPVNLTVSGLPEHVTYQMIPNPVTPPIGGTVFSTLRVCTDSSAAVGNYTITLTGSGKAPDNSAIVHTLNLELRVRQPFVPVNWLVILLVLLLLLLAIGLALLAVFLSRKRGRVRPRVQYVLPLPTVRCRNCGRLIPIHVVYCPYCGRPQVILARRPPRLVSPRRRMTRNTIMGTVLSIVAGILIILNSAALLVPSFYGPPIGWSSIFFWLPSLGQSYAFALGMIIGLVLILCAIVMVLGHGALADVVIFPFAVFSLIIGGGFVAGMVLGIVGGIIGALKR
jgi:hypothetical protein